MIRRFSRFFPYVAPVLIAGVLVAVIGIGVFTNRALRSIEEQLPATVLAQEHDIALVVQDLADLIRAVEGARLTSNPRRFTEIFGRLDAAIDRLQRIRGSYNFDNLVNASSTHAIANPALSDIERWLKTGIPGFPQTSEEVLLLVQRRAEDAYAKVREQYMRSDTMARQILSEQANRLEDFRQDVRQLLFGTGLLAGLIVVLAIYQRVTERRRYRAELAQRDSETRFRALIEHAPFAINLKDRDGRYILMNREFAELVGGSAEALIGKTVFDLGGSPEHAALVDRHDRQVLETRTPVEYEMAGVLDATRTYVSVKFPIIGQDGEVVAVGAVWINVTELKKAEERSRTLQNDLAHISRLSTMGEMAAGFAHELNQPLTAIHNYAAGITRRLGTRGADPTAIVTVMQRICEQAQLASGIIHRIRRFIRKEEAEKRPTDVNQAIRAAVDLLRSDAAKHNVTIRLDLADDLPAVSADAIGIQQVVVNLVRNAIEAVGEGASGLPVVTVQTRRTDEGKIRVAVHDTGPGIAPEVRDRLFEPFFTTKREGLGVGLLICRSIIDDHQGRLTVAGTGTAGTTAEFTLPMGGEA